MIRRPMAQEQDEVESEVVVPPETAGIVLSPAMAAELTALRMQVRKELDFNFGRALLAVCEAATVSGTQVEQAISGNPTLAARKLLKNNELQAMQVSPGILEVWPCMTLGPELVTVRTTNEGETCFRYLPVHVMFAGKKHSAYLDPVTLILSSVSPRVTCDRGRWVLLPDPEGYKRIDQITGSVVEIKHDQIKTLNLDQEAINFHAILSMQVFHNLVLTNISDVAPLNHLEANELSMKPSGGWKLSFLPFSMLTVQVTMSPHKLLAKDGTHSSVGYT